jgi:hypothetical protein
MQHQILTATIYF